MLDSLPCSQYNEDMKKRCATCDKEFLVPPSNSKKRWCSRVCYDADRRKGWPSHQILSELYEKQQFSITMISARLGISESSIFDAMRYHGIVSRSAGEGIKLAHQQGRVNKSNHRRGFTHPQWKGGRSHCGGGYIRILEPEHHRANHHGYVLEHVLVWEKHHKQELPQGWVVHHLNGITNDNRPENLVGLPTKKHNLIFKAKAQRIKQLEDEVAKLVKVIKDKQLIFTPEIREPVEVV